MVVNNNDNNNEYLERLTRTGLKCLHVLYKYIFVKIQCIQHEWPSSKATVSELYVVMNNGFLQRFMWL